jgi:hypothetical protein
MFKVQDMNSYVVLNIKNIEAQYSHLKLVCLHYMKSITPNKIGCQSFLLSY